MWRKIHIDLKVTNWFMAGIPKSPDMIKNWLESRQPSEAAYVRRQAAGEVMTPVAELAERVAEQVDSDEERAWLGFKRDDREGLYIDGNNIKAHLKDCANILQKLTGIKALRSKLADRVYVVDERIYLGVAEPSGAFEHPVHVMTAQGPRSALKRNDYVDQPNLTFVLNVLDDGVITDDLLKQIFEYGSVHGIGAERGLGYGRYRIESFEQV